MGGAISENRTHAKQVEQCFHLPLDEYPEAARPLPPQVPAKSTVAVIMVIPGYVASHLNQIGVSMTAPTNLQGPITGGQLPLERLRDCPALLATSAAGDRAA